MLAAAGLVAVVAATGWHLPVDTAIVLLVVVTLAGLAVGTRRPSLLVLSLMVVVGARATNAVDSLGRAPLARVHGPATLVSDPRQRLFDTSVVVSIDGRRYAASVPMAKAWRLKDLLAGERIVVEGSVRALRGAPRGWVLSNHLAGRLDVTGLERGGPAPPWYELANALRRTIQRGAGSMNAEHRALYMGLVVGDDRKQSELMQFQFRASGLAHLLAVSGQNVAFVLAAATPLMRRLGPWSRILTSAALLGLFALVTGAEPSVMRAVLMAVIALAAVTAGRSATGLRVLAMTVIALLVIDPLMVHSMGFQLSVCATTGLLVFTSPIERRLSGPDWVRLPLAVTVAAQLSTAPLVMKLAGGLPASATIANLVAVPVAGLVMMFGVTVGLVAGLVRSSLAQILLLPAEVMVRWIGWVAQTASRLPTATFGPLRMVVATTALLVLVGRPAPRCPALVRACAALVVVGACLAPRPSAGRQVMPAGAELFRGRCGETVLVVGSGARAADLLDQLWLAGLRHIDAVAISGTRTSERVAGILGRQFDAATVDLGDHGMRVGTLEVSLSDTPADVGMPSTRIVDSGAECKF